MTRKTVVQNGSGQIAVSVVSGRPLYPMMNGFKIIT